MKSFASTLCLLTVLVTGSLAQWKIETGELKGFTASPDEHIMNRTEKPFSVRSIEGVIVDPTGTPRSGVLVEIRGPDDKEEFHSAVTDKRGYYHIKHVKHGTYMFKTTLQSFQSEYGTIVLSKKADPHARVDLKLPVGV